MGLEWLQTVGTATRSEWGATLDGLIYPESTDGFVGSTVWGRAGLECGAGAVGGAWGWAALRGALSGGSDEQGQAAAYLCVNVPRRRRTSTSFSSHG